ncbi:MAG TPA: hypothetical protein VFG88_07105, partial [Nocardioidaceae bacterium]|nr:hypothetical protein [Nocardioidaceae bacterium]
LPAEEVIQLPPRDTKKSEKAAKKEQEDIERGRALRLSRGETSSADEVDAPRPESRRGSDEPTG